MKGSPQPAKKKAPASKRASQASVKLLRACVVQSGKVLDERRLKQKENLTLGNSPQNTFVVAEPGLPNSHQLFRRKGGAYELVLSEGMRGRISVDDKVIDFATLKAQGLMKKKGDFYRLKINEKQRGKVVIGGVTLIFQFVQAPPEPAKLRLPAAARGSIWSSIDWPFAVLLLLALAFEAPLIYYFEVAPKPNKLTLDTISDRWANLVVPERKPEEEMPKLDEAKLDTGLSTEKKKEAPKKEDNRSDKQKAKAKAVRSAKIREKISGKGILAILGTKGGSAASGAVADVFAEGGIGGDLDAAFEGIGGVGIASGSERTTRGGGTGEAASIGGLATAGGGKVGLGKKAEKRVVSTKFQAPEVDGALDSEAIAKVVRARKRMLQDCYERELKRDPSLSGRIEIEFTIGESGRVDEALVVGNTMGNDAVGACIVSRIRRWRFPKPDGGTVTVTFPFIFTSSG